MLGIIYREDNICPWQRGHNASVLALFSTTSMPSLVSTGGGCYQCPISWSRLRPQRPVCGSVLLITPPPPASTSSCTFLRGNCHATSLQYHITSSGPETPLLSSAITVPEPAVCVTTRQCVPRPEWIRAAVTRGSCPPPWRRARARAGRT